jgi:hypothetical protein
MPLGQNRRAGGPRNTPKIRLRSSHTSRVRLGVSHRGAGTSWRAPAKEGDVLHERDLLPAGAAADTLRIRRG